MQHKTLLDVALRLWRLHRDAYLPSEYSHDAALSPFHIYTEGTCICFWFRNQKIADASVAQIETHSLLLDGQSGH